MLEREGESAPGNFNQRDWAVSWYAAIGALTEGASPCTPVLSFAILNEPEGGTADMLQAVVFDFDGLIVDTESIWFDIYRDLLSEEDVNLTLETFCACVGSTNEVLYQFYEQQTGVKLDAASFQKRARTEFDTRMNHPELRAGVMDYLREAKQRGLRIGLASSSHRPWIDRFLNHFDIHDYFEVISTGDQVEKVKPDPALYVQTIERLGVKPRATLAFEDSLNGCKAALGAGMHCVAVPNSVTSVLTFPDEVLRIDSMGSICLEDVIQRIEENENNCAEIR